MESPQIRYIKSKIESFMIVQQENYIIHENDENQKKIDIRIINRKIKKLFKETELNLEEIVKLKSEKQHILSTYNLYNYCYTRCKLFIQTEKLKLYDELEDCINNNCAYEPYLY
jgi:hypothetical protein